jgi:hypothetical protein
VFWGERWTWEERSPDGRYVAALYEGDNGALGDAGMHLHLVDGFVPLSLRYAGWDAPGFLAAGRSLSVEWQGPRHLIVTGCEHPFPTRWRDVTISYR